MKRNWLVLASSVVAMLSASLAVAEGRVAIVDESKLATHWVPLEGVARVMPGFPTGGDHAQDVCVTIGFQISSKGAIGNFAQLRAWSSGSGAAEPPEALTDPYVQLAAAAISRWQFVAKGRAKAVYTSATFAFPGASTPADAVRAHYQIEDLQAFV
ncbi:MAG: hypothetical protein ABI588_01720, partial [Arenimonas sp.]